jgi:hypothetical protein
METKPQKSETDPTSLRSSFIQSLAERPCSALDYLYGQCLHVAAIRDNETRRLQERENIDDILATEEILAEDAANLLETVLFNHPQAGHLRAAFGEFSEANGSDFSCASHTDPASVQ